MKLAGAHSNSNSWHQFSKDILCFEVTSWCLSQTKAPPMKPMQMLPSHFVCTLLVWWLLVVYTRLSSIMPAKEWYGFVFLYTSFLALKISTTFSYWKSKLCFQWPRLWKGINHTGEWLSYTSLAPLFSGIARTLCREEPTSTTNFQLIWGTRKKWEFLLFSVKLEKTINLYTDEQKREGTISTMTARDLEQSSNKLWTLKTSTSSKGKKQKRG
jgi:hypothetical protein